MKSKILTALLSVAIALAIWAYVVTTVSPNADMEYDNIPVMLQGEAQLYEVGYMVTAMDTSEVDLQLEGNRRELERLSASDIKVTLDVSKNPVTGTQELDYNISFAGKGQNAFKVLTKSPATIKVTLENWTTKAVPVNVQFDGNVADDFMADKENMVLDYTEVKVTGPQSEVDQIAMAQVSVDIEGRNETLSDRYAYVLCNEQGVPVNAPLVTTDITEINLSLKIMRVKEIRLVAKIIDGGGATSQNTKVTIAPETVWVSGSDNLLEDLEELEICTLDLSEYAEDQNLTFPIKLPDGITDETGVLEASVGISFEGLAVKTLTVKKIIAENVPVGMKAELLTKALEIQVRGPKDLLEQLSEDAVTVMVDFTQTEVGTVKMKARFVFADPAFGVVGSYTVSANVTQR